MTDLRLVALTPDRSHLVLEDDATNQFRVPIDERLANALRTPAAASTGAAATRKPGQLEIALESQLSPREIQTRIRAGRSVDEVALAAGISVDRVERYAAPVVAEREHVTEQARLALSRRSTGGQVPRLGDLVDSRLAEQRVDEEAISWDSWRGDDERWTVQLTYRAGTRDRVAHWTYDPRGRVLSAANDEARWLVDEAALERDEDGAPPPQRRLASVPHVEPAEPAAAPPAGDPEGDQVYDREADEARAAAVGGGGGAAPSAPTASESSERGRQTARGGRRPAVPSWDDILLGARKHD